MRVFSTRSPSRWLVSFLHSRLRTSRSLSRSHEHEIDEESTRMEF